MFLTPTEIVEVLSSPDKAKLLIGVVQDNYAQQLCLYWGNGKACNVPYSIFTPEENTNTSKPDFNDVRVGDYGVSLLLGCAYEVPSDWLYDEAMKFKAADPNRPSK